MKTADKGFPADDIPCKPGISGRLLVYFHMSAVLIHKGYNVLEVL